jgi:hypothetical protein
LQRKTAFASFLVENNVDCALDEIEEFVAVGVHLSCMRGTLRHSGLSRESALDTWMSATALGDLSLIWTQPRAKGDCLVGGEAVAAIYSACLRSFIVRSWP